MCQLKHSCPITYLRLKKSGEREREREREIERELGERRKKVGERISEPIGHHDDPRVGVVVS
jgi:hypothetical protein